MGDRMKNFINNFLLYFQFLTRVPIKKNLNCSEKNFRDGIYFFPIVGLSMGLLQWVIFKGASYFFNANIAAIFVMIAPIIMTGGLHVDGLGDVFDGFFCFKGDSQKLLEVMKDSRIGTYACIAIVIDLLLKFTLISAIINSGYTNILILSPVIARISVVYICTIGKRAKKVSSANVYIKNTNFKGVLIAFILCGIISYFCVGIVKSIILIASALILSTIFNLFCNRRIGGLNGDTLGCNFEIVDIFVMLVYVGMFKF